jgi:hypothetical protein
MICCKDNKEIHNEINWFKIFLKYIIETDQSINKSFDNLFY